MYNSKRRPTLGKKDVVSHTKRVADSTDLDIWTCPFLGDMSQKVKVSLENSRAVITLAAGGSAAGYIIDAIQQHRMSNNSTKLTCLYTSRDPALFNWISRVVAHLLQERATENLNVLIALTDGDAAEDTVLSNMVAQKQKDIEEFASGSSSSSDDDHPEKSTLRIQYGRINFAKEIPERNVVYFQGSGGLQKAVQEGCKKKRCRMIAGPAYDQDRRRRRTFCRHCGLLASTSGEKPSKLLSVMTSLRST